MRERRPLKQIVRTTQALVHDYFFHGEMGLLSIVVKDFHVERTMKLLLKSLFIFR